MSGVKQKTLNLLSSCERLNGMRDVQPTHFNWRVNGSVAVVSLARPERNNPLTFDSYAELRDLFRALASDDVIKAGVIASNGGIAKQKPRFSGD